MTNSTRFIQQLGVNLLNMQRARIRTLDYVLLRLPNSFAPMPRARNFLQKQLLGAAPMSLLECTKALDRIADDPRALGVILHLRGISASYADLQTLLNDAYARFDTAELGERLDEEQVPWAFINTRCEVIHDAQIKAMGALLEFDHPIAGPMRQPRPPGRFHETPADIFRCSPELGEQTREVLAECGYSQEEITQMRADGVVR